MKKIVDKRWFFLFELATAIISSALWFSQLWISQLQLSWEPLLIALLPWAIRLAAGRFPFRRTLLDLFMIVFLVTALSGVWAAYDQDAAWAKFWLIIASILIYYAISGQPPVNLWPVAYILSVGGMVAAGYFLLTYDWQTHPARLAIMNVVGLRVMALRPAIGVPALHPNVAASLIAMAIPFSVAVVLSAWGRRSQRFLFALAFTSFLLISLLLTESRGAWAALSVGMGLWLLWSGCRRSAGPAHLKPCSLFVGFLLLGGVVSLVLVTRIGHLDNLLNTLSGLSGIVSRMTLMHQTTQLIADFGLLGSGLATFPGLYSQYILVNPFLFIGHGHNLFLNVMLEQGFLGFLALIAVLGGSFWSLVRFQPLANVDRVDLLRWATTASFLVMFAHGLIDDTLYGERGTPLLFLLAGLAVTIGQGVQYGKIGSVRFLKVSARPFKIVVIVVVSLLLFFSYVKRQSLLAKWYANRGAIEMARVELQDWPTNRWDDGSNAAALQPIKTIFQRALQLDPDNRTAHYRLGLIAMLQRDFGMAVQHLEAAYAIDKEHRGITKTLGYSYVWNGELNLAVDMLKDIPEARDELETYVWWWQTQGHENLAQQAAFIVNEMDQVSEKSKASFQ